MERRPKQQYPGIKISFEGIDGSGKTTQTQLVRETLEKMGYRVFRAPDNSDAEGNGIDDKILSILKENRDRFFRIGYPVTENLLLAARASYLDDRITLPKLNQGYVVLADRDVDTFIAYGMPSLRDKYDQLGNHEVMEWMISIVSLGRAFPDLTILLEPHLQAYLPRATVGVYEEKKKDTFGKKEIDFMEEVKIYYSWLAERFPDRIRVVDVVNQSREEVLEVLLDIIIPFIEENEVPKK